MTAKPRRWFQIHLSTAIVLMFVAGALLWVLVHPSHVTYEDHYNTVNSYVRGWPLIYSEDLETVSVLNIFELPNPIEFSWIRLAADICIAVLPLAAIAIFFEYILHRREARKT